MANKYGNSSLAHLNTLHPNLAMVMLDALKTMDHSIIEGYRNEERQNELFDAGKSKLRYPDGKHNCMPSLAVDAIPYPVDWEDRERMTLFAGIVLGVASQFGIAIRWGGDWNGDGQVKDNKFDDLVHFELVGKQ